jgi:hypothetical protein
MLHATKVDMLDSSVAWTSAYSLHHKASQPSGLVRHRAYTRVWLRFELGILLLAFRIDTNLTDSTVTHRNTYKRSTNVQKLLYCHPDQHNLEQRIPENGVRR